MSACGAKVEEEVVEEQKDPVALDDKPRFNKFRMTHLNLIRKTMGCLEEDQGHFIGDKESKAKFAEDVQLAIMNHAIRKVFNAMNKKYPKVEPKDWKEDEIETGFIKTVTTDAKANHGITLKHVNKKEIDSAQ